MICFSVERPESLENVEAKWIGEVDHYCPEVRIVLVGKSSLNSRYQASEGLISTNGMCCVAVYSSEV